MSHSTGSSEISTGSSEINFYLGLRSCRNANHWLAIVYGSVDSWFLVKDHAYTVQLPFN